MSIIFNNGEGGGQGSDSGSGCLGWLLLILFVGMTYFWGCENKSTKSISPADLIETYPSKSPSVA